MRRAMVRAPGSGAPSHPEISSTDLHLFIAEVCRKLLNRILIVCIVLLSNDVQPPLNAMTCANGNLLNVFVGRAQLGRQVHRDICVLSSTMSTIDISCKSCEFDYWESSLLLSPWRSVNLTTLE
ncbi:hypothetical protein E2C01_097185 [Portunus trituberculatus]|uniref:Uncharacterized protein n=1 Tax=Portunus trituberculatus TaxID=210409 RepID=A0A5B7K8X1_PORTR|nr:hypothetical protein [Portunus trituberculatus]